MCYFSCSLEKNTPKFRITIFHFRINPCVEMLKWRATRHSKAEKLNFVLRKCTCSLGNNRGLILTFGYHAENPWKTRHFYFEALFGYHKVSWWYPKFSQEKVWYFSFKMTCRTFFWIARTEIISKNKRTPNKVSGLYVEYCDLM